MKMIIDIPDYNLDDVQNGSIACGQILKAVKNGTLISTGGDLISRSELKKTMEQYKPLSVETSSYADGERFMLTNCIREINNAKVVDAIVNTIEVRPQGEWIIQPHSMIMKCSLCGHEENAKDVGTINPYKHFCYFCGADMCKGGKK